MSKQNIQIAMGSLAYAIAKVDGEIQIEEKQVLKSLAQKEFELDDSDMGWIDKVFLNHEKENIRLEDAYKYALDVLEANRYEFDFDAKMKNKCIQFMEKVAESFRSSSAAEQILIERFKKDTVSF